eukprot:CAMPEP_0168542068 /NCGR_PEP_ID=MMETSP0413-20121227/1149_1 /TAXON_ID=136452 /ORGANISM="Filamoeba nolandi, Strain NC-AS-23-1" /LENGTH=703 /DNA_ID=CAMNT_0008571917 /DNA_START=186 /DNA_END=2294 /DNA_ORIENTATION=-
MSALGIFNRTKTRKDLASLVNFHILLDDPNTTDQLDHIFASYNQKGGINQQQMKKLLSEADAEGQLPIHKAMKFPNSKVVQSFLDFYKKNSFDINQPDQLGYTPLHNILTNSEIESSIILQMLTDFTDLKVDACNKENNTALHFFCKAYTRTECTEIGELIIQKGGKKLVNWKNQYGETPLHKAIFNQVVRLLMIDLLIRNGADVNVKNDKGETSLHYAIYLSRKDIITALFVGGADIKIKGSGNKTPLEVAIETGNHQITKHLKQIKSLVDWADNEDIDRHYVDAFVKEELFLDVLMDADDATLQSVGVDKAGVRIKILTSLKKLKESPANFDSPRSSLGSSTSSPNVSSSSYPSNDNNKASSSTATHGGASSASSKFNPLYEDEAEDVKSTLEECGSVSDVADLKQGLKQRSASGVSNAADDMIINKSDLEFTKKLGEGQSGRVYKGLYKGKYQVAIKVLKSIQDVNEFKKEFYIMSSIKSPSIVKFYGACIDPQCAMVMEYCSRGSLYDVMHDDKLVFDWNLFFKFSLEACKAIQSLHTFTPPIVHRDLKSLNLLVNENLDVLLADFGLSRFTSESNAETLMKVCGTIAYADPQLFFLAGPYTTKCDIYSLAMVIWELIARTLAGVYCRPYEEYPDLKFDFQIITQVHEKKVRPTLPAHTPKELSSIVFEGWDHDRNKRPDVGELIKRLEAAKEVYKKNT